MLGPEVPPEVLLLLPVTLPQLLGPVCSPCLALKALRQLEHEGAHVPCGRKRTQQWMGQASQPEGPRGQTHPLRDLGEEQRGRPNWSKSRGELSDQSLPRWGPALGAAICHVLEYLRPAGCTQLQQLKGYPGGEVQESQ